MTFGTVLKWERRDRLYNFKLGYENKICHRIPKRHFIFMKLAFLVSGPCCKTCEVMKIIRSEEIFSYVVGYFHSDKRLNYLFLV
jgi:uncharacterized membrane protein